MKNTLKFLPFLLLGLCFVLSSCSEDTVELDKNDSTHNEVSYTYKNKPSSQQKTLNCDLETRVTSSTQLDIKNITQEELLKLLELDKPDIEVLISCKDQIYLDLRIEDGDLVEVNGDPYPNNDLCPECDHDADGNIKDKLNCSQDGIKHCAYATYQQWSDLKIIFMSITGGAQAVLGDCIARNCAGF